jgi:predicted dehydrogenase
MQFILFGAGSVGQRHLRNALSLGHQVVAVCDRDSRKLEEAKGIAPGALLFQQEADALEQSADAVLVCSPTALHVAQARLAIKHGLHVFVEKPLSHTLDHTEDLIKEATAAERVVLVGCNLRFFPSLQLVKQLLDDGRIGKPLAARAQCGYYLPFWHPDNDYRNSYSANEGAGGGVILDSVHEFDYLRWLFGDVTELFCYAGKVSNLEIDTDDNADILLRFSSGVLANVHLDYLQRTYRRSCELIGEDGVIVWDYITQVVSLYGKKDRQVEVYLESINVERNQMFIEEVKHFVTCIEGREKPALDTAEARVVLKIALAAKTSAVEGRVVNIGK